MFWTVLRIGVVLFPRPFHQRHPIVAAGIPLAAVLLGLLVWALQLVVVVS